MICRHCQDPHAYYARGLCYKCYHNKEVRESYSVEGVYPRMKGYGQKPNKPLTGSSALTDHWGVLLPDEPTQELPGSMAKIEVMCQRAGLGVALHHPQDMKMSTYYAQQEEILRRLRVLGEESTKPLSCKDVNPEYIPGLGD